MIWFSAFDEMIGKQATENSCVNCDQKKGGLARKCDLEFHSKPSALVKGLISLKEWVPFSNLSAKKKCIYILGGSHRGGAFF